MRARHDFAAVLALLLLLSPAGAREPASRTVPMRVDFPAATEAYRRVPVRGGVPFPRGALGSAENVRLTARRAEIAAQVVRTALWPDGSVKWVLIDAVLSPDGARALKLEYGPGVSRARIKNPVAMKRSGKVITVTGPKLAGTIGGGVTRLSIEGRDLLTKGPLRPVLECRRGGRVTAGRVVVEDLVVESPGPVRGRALVRGHFAVPGWGSGLPKHVLREEPAGRVPFSFRLDFVRGLPIVLGSHRIVFTGEPDEDFIVRWGMDLPGCGAGSTRLIREPGLTEDRGAGKVEIVDGLPGRLCRAPLTHGLALIRGGFENRPCAVGGPKGGTARVDFRPAEAGAWDLRRYAREWGVGETGKRDRPEDMVRYAKFAARGMAKTHTFVLDLGGAGGDLDARAGSLAEPAILTAPPAWYARSGVFGSYAVEDRRGRFKELDAGVRRYLDWFRFNQDLYRWYGPLAYGFWQTRNGNIHRHDRWDRDYGRWGWSLGDGAGRIGHLLMFTYLRTLERRYFTAGAAWNRAAYDTAMVHTNRHLENATATWWRVKGCSHRHGVQPFSGPYIGLRGSYPYGHRIQWFLTGDGMMKDDLDLVAQTALEYATTRPGAFGGSGGSDGQGAGALALLFAHETTGDSVYLDACLGILDRSDLVPPGAGKRLGYGPDFGLFLAAGEYLALTGDEAFRKRYLALADRAAAAKDPARYLTVLADALRLTGHGKYREALDRALVAIDVGGTLAELPVARWPGHGGARRPPSRANVGRDLPYAFAALGKETPRDAWPKAVPDPVTIPARVPADWIRPAGAQAPRDRLPDPAKLLARKAPRGNGAVEVGDTRFRVADGKLAVEHGEDATSLASIRAFAGSGRPARFGCAAGSIAAKGDAGRSRFMIRLVPAKVDGVPSARLEVGIETREEKDGPTPLVVVLGLDVSPLPGSVHLAAAGSFRVERWRVDQNDEVIPEWLNSDRRTRWPLWRRGGLVLGNAGSYRISKRNRADTAPLFVDQGFGSPGWMDVSDRGSTPWRGVTVRLLRDPANPVDDVERSVRFDWESRELRIEIRPPGPGRWSGAADLIFHDGWRPPLGKPDLTRAQYAAFLDDLDYGGNIGLFALRFLLSETHQVGPGDWKRMLAERGVEPRELLLNMEWRDGLRKHCGRIGVRYDPDRPDATVGKVIERYRRR